MKDFINLLLGKEVTFEHPWKLSDESLTVIVPITLKKKINRNYLLFEEAKDKIKITDSGVIGKLKVSGDVDKPIFFRGGTAFEGMGTQSRVASYGKILYPNKPEQTIEANCIHASHGIRANAEFKDAGFVPHEVEEILLDKGRRWNQSNVWYAVANHNRSSMATSTIESSFNGFTTTRYDDLIGTQRLVESTEKFKKEVEEKLAKIPDYTTQIGVVIINIKGILGLEVFDSQESWMALAKSITKKYVKELMEKSEEAIYSLDNTKIFSIIQNFIESLKNIEEKLLFENETSKTHTFNNERVVGEYTELDGKTIHLIATRKEKDIEPQTRQIDEVVWQPIIQNTWLDSIQDGRYMTTTNYTSENFLNRKEANTFLLSLAESSKTWTELKSSVKLSDAGLSKTITKAEELNLIEKVPRMSNGKPSYRLTAKGHYLKEITGQ